MIVVAIIVAVTVGFLVALAARRRRLKEVRNIGSGAWSGKHTREVRAQRRIRRGEGFETVSVVVNRVHGPSCGCEACLENFLGAAPLVDRVHGPSCGCEACLENYVDQQEGWKS